MPQNSKLTGTWDGAELTVVVGVLPLSGLSDGDSVTARRNQPFYNSRAGNDGAVGRAKVTDKRGQIEIHILQTSEMNDLLSTTFNLDSLSEEGSFVGPIVCKDLSGRTVISAGDAWLMQVGDVTFASGEVGERVYTFEAADLIMNLGGNN
jgi:hypothetical protein